MGDNNAVYGTQNSSAVSLTASASDVEIVTEPKYVSLDDRTTQVTLPDDSQYIVVTKISYSALVGACSFFLHGGEATPVQLGPKLAGAANDSDTVDVHLRFPLGAPVKASATVAAGATLNISVEYHVVATQNRTPSKQDYA